MESYKRGVSGVDVWIPRPHSTITKPHLRAGTAKIDRHLDLKSSSIKPSRQASATGSPSSLGLCDFTLLLTYSKPAGNMSGLCSLLE